MTSDEDVAAKAHDGRDTFRPTTVADRFTKHVRDDHAANSALYNAIAAAAEDDDRIIRTNLMSSHAPGEKPHDPRHYVVVEFVNGGQGTASAGPTFVQRLIDRDHVSVIHAEASSSFESDFDPWADDADVEGAVDALSDFLTLHLRPVETRVEPIDVPVRDIPDELTGIPESTVAAFLGDVDTRLREELRSTSPVRIFRDVVGGYDHELPESDLNGADDRLRPIDERLSEFPDGWDGEDVGPSAPPGLVAALSELASGLESEASNWGEDRGAPYLRAAEQIRSVLDEHVPGNDTGEDGDVDLSEFTPFSERDDDPVDPPDVEAPDVDEDDGPEAPGVNEISNARPGEDGVDDGE